MGKYSMVIMAYVMANNGEESLTFWSPGGGVFWYPAKLPLSTR
jgi:hypothetical protein